MKVIVWILTAVVGGFALLLIIGAMSKPPHVSGYTQTNGKWVAADPGDRKNEARNGIAACWKDQARKSLDPATARFVAGTCEKMESDFFTQWGYKP